MFIHPTSSYALVRAIQRDRLARAAASKRTVPGYSTDVRSLRLALPSSVVGRPECPEQRLAS